MNVGGIICGTIAAALGALAWGAIAYFGNVEIGYLAWGIGLLVGLGVSLGSKQGGIAAAGLAVVLTVVSLLGGKYAAVSMMARELDSQIPEFVMTDEDLQMRLASLELESVDGDKTQLNFRNGTDYETAESLDDYPQSIAEAAKTTFESMSEQEKGDMKKEAEKEYQEVIASVVAQITNQGFLDSFGPIDIIFLLLGVVTAGKIALADVIE